MSLKESNNRFAINPADQSLRDQSLCDQSSKTINTSYQSLRDQSLCDQSPLVINFFEINCVAINPADAVDRAAIDPKD
jgi:hypothetical protein